MFSKKYSFDTVVSDLFAGLTSAIAYLALGAALGIVSGRGAFAGVIACAVISGIVAVCGGTRRQLTVPTPTMAVPMAGVVAFAYDTFGQTAQADQFLTMAIVSAGAILIIAGIFNLGRYISLIPNLIVYGFANGLALLLWWNQITKVL